jgi:hypothetical protein
MISTKCVRFSLAVLGLAFSMFAVVARSQQNQVMGELQFSGATRVEKNSGVWIDGQYVGFLRELKGDKKIMLLPGEHALAVRHAGYADYEQTVVVEPGQVQILHLQMAPIPNGLYRGNDVAELKLDVKPERAAVFVDNRYVGHAGEFSGALRYMEMVPGTHRIKVELPGYQTFETEVSLLPRQKSKIETDLVGGSILQAGPLIKEQ